MDKFKKGQIIYILMPNGTFKKAKILEILDDKYSLTRKIASGKITNIDLIKVDKDFATLSILNKNGKYATCSNQFEFIPNIKTAYYDANSGIVKLPIE